MVRVSTLESNPQHISQPSVGDKGKLQSRMVKPISGMDEDGAKAISKAISGALGAIMLIVSIILWAVGASQGNPSLTLAGQILFGISIAPIAIPIAIACLCCPCIAAWCISNAKGNES